VSWMEKTPVIIGGYPSRCFQRTVEDGHLTVFVGKEPLGPGGMMRWHMSISHRSSFLVMTNGSPLPGRIPSWDEIKEARYRFCPDETYMSIILPPKAEYVNVHPTTMHLHEIDKNA
jgi:hypothetical protein